MLRGISRIITQIAPPAPPAPPSTNIVSAVNALNSTMHTMKNMQLIGFSVKAGLFALGAIGIAAYIISGASSKPKAEIPKERLKDLIDPPEQAKQVVKALQNDKIRNFTAVRRILLEGLPGTGKTTLASAIAGEIGANFIKVGSADLETGFVGGGAKTIRNIFNKAQKFSKNGQKSVIFLDEFEAAAGQRLGIGVNKAHEGTTVSLLMAIDSVKDDSNIIIIGATNYVDSLDKAIKSRFAGNLINVSLPTHESRLKILKHYVPQNIQIDDDVLEEVASQTDGSSGRNLEMYVQNACMTAILRESTQVTREDFDLLNKEGI